MSQLILKRASTSRPSGEWSDDDFDVLANGGVVGRIFKAAASPVGLPRGSHAAHGYEATREAAMAAFAAKSWRRGVGARVPRPCVRFHVPYVQVPRKMTHGRPSLQTAGHYSQRHDG
jgi:hypothetical protein